MPPDQAYPSPSAAQVSGGSGPFFQQNGDPGPIPNDLQQLQAAADRSLDNASMVQSLGHGGYPHQPDDQNGMVPVQPTSPERLAQGMAQGVLNMGDGQDFSPVAQVGPRKRSKVSRACDECRRKKVRLPAWQSEKARSLNISRFVAMLWPRYLTNLAPAASVPAHTASSVGSR